MYQVSETDKPRWQACFAYTVDQSILNDPDTPLEKVISLAKLNFKEENYPIPKFAKINSERIKRAKESENRKAAKMDPELQEFVKVESARIHDEFPQLSKKEIKKKAILQWSNRNKPEKTKKSYGFVVNP